MNVTPAADPAAAMLAAALASQQQLLTLAMQGKTLDAAKAAVLPQSAAGGVDLYA